MQIKHNFISAKADGSDASLIRPSNWNEDHVITMATGKVLGRVTAGDGTAEEVDWTAFGRSLINLADVPALRDLLGGVHIGEFKAFAMSSLPSGWLNCNGAAVSRTTYSALFAAIGTVWGAGNGTTTFNVPDLRGRTLAAMDESAGRLTTLSGGSGGLGAVGGAQTHTLTEAQLPAHDHTYNGFTIYTNTTGGHYHTYRNGSDTERQSGGSTSVQNNNNSGDVVNTSYAGDHYHSITVPSGSTNNAGSGSSHNNVQPTATARYGIFAGV